jgi:hypothetical protein
VTTERKKSRRFGRIALAVLGVAALVAALATMFGWLDRLRNADEEYAVYSAYLSREMVGDAHDWSVGVPIDVVIFDQTTPMRLNLKWKLRGPDGRVIFDGLPAMTRISFTLRNLYHTQLQSNFRLPNRARAALASTAEIHSPDFETRFPNNVGYIALSGVGFNANRTEALFYIAHFCPLCGGAGYVWMEKRNGLWRVRDRVNAWMS